MPSGESASFSASYDRATKAISAGIWLLPLLVAFGFHNAIGGLLMGGLLLLISAVAYAYSPRGYEVSAEAILVKRPIGDARVPLEEVREVRPARREDLRWCVRLWGNGGLFGYYGWYRTAKLGRCSWYVTDRGRIVILVTASRTTAPTT